MDAKQEEDKKVSNWIAETREVAYDAEDAIENYNLRDFASKWTLKRKLNVGSEIESIQKKISLTLQEV